ncbi:MAG: hypothetical protein ACKO8G_01835, partial [Actinomycetota bacterium]
MPRDLLAAVLEGWASHDAAFERVIERPWGAVVADARFPRLLACNYARVSARESVLLPEVGIDPPPTAPTPPPPPTPLPTPQKQPEL